MSVRQAAGPPREAVAELIQRTAAAAPRSLQVEMGPSEAGEPCTRRLAYKIMDWRKPGRDLDPWAAVQGVAVHAWLADAFRAENERLGRVRYLVEQRVQPVSVAERPGRRAREPGRVMRPVRPGLPRAHGLEADQP